MTPHRLYFRRALASADPPATADASQILQNVRGDAAGGEVLQKVRGDAAGGEVLQKVRGYAAVFGVSADGQQESDRFRVGRWSVRRGAFAEVLAAGGDVAALVNHDENQLLARTAAGTLTLVEDDVGLACGLAPCATSLWRDVLAHLAAGNLRGMSFTCDLAESDVETRTDPDGVRAAEIVHVSALYDVSICTFPYFERSRAWIAPDSRKPDFAIARRLIALAARRAKLS